VSVPPRRVLQTAGLRLPFLLLAGCSGAGGGDGPVDLGPTGLLAVPEHGRQLTSEPYDLEPGREVTRCYHVNLGNEEVLEVARFETNQRPGQHHFNIFMSDLEREDGWGRCPDSIELFVGARPIVDGSAGAVSYAFPDGMAFPLPKSTLLILQLHSINTTPEPLEQQFVMNLHTRETPASTHVDIFGFTTFEIELPPKQTTTIRKDCPIYDPIGLLSVTSHFHARGDLATAEIVTDGASSGIFYRNERWDDPEVMFFEDPMRVGNGDVFRFECTYTNDDDFTVRYGPSADDEMCFVFGYYFPKQGLIPCL
jgi:hypothetical protein